MSKCVCCGANLEYGATRCKYCGAAAPVTAQNNAPQGNVNQAPNQNQNQTQNQAQNQTQNLDVLQALMMNNVLAVEAARTAAEAARSAAEAARSAAEAASNRSTASASSGRSSSSASSSSGKECGANIFACSNWEEIWRAKGRENRYQGIILTNTKGLKNPDAFTAALNSYLQFKSQNGVDYYVLDISNQAICEVDDDNLDDLLWMLYEAYMVTVPHYLLIVGDSSVVPCAQWDNPSDTFDDNVPSDLAYISLESTSPWDGVEYDFENITQVGRIPAKSANGFSEAIAYFEHAQRFKPYNGTATFAYSANVWQETTRVEFSHLKPNLITSPKYTSNRGDAGSNGLWLLEKINPGYNMLCFNLHGSDDDHFWYGQLGEYFYPEAFASEYLPQNGGYALLSEACYGARPTYTDSIVVNALKNGCMAFVGSTRVAYGCGDGSLCCADVIAQHYTYHLATGETAGNSFLKALSALLAPQMHVLDIKTLAEFGLYGDPSFRLVATGAHGMQKGKKGGATAVKYSKPKKDKSRAITLASCDGASAKKGKSSRIVPLSYCSSKEQAQMKLMANHVSKVGGEYMMKNFASIANVKPDVFKVVGRDEYCAVYGKKIGSIKMIVHMQLDGKGNVKNVYHSK